MEVYKPILTKKEHKDVDFDREIMFKDEDLVSVNMPHKDFLVLTLWRVNFNV